mgnify:FL=1
MTSKAKKALKITGNVLTVAVAILVVIMTVLTVFSMVFNRDGTASVFGVQAYVVQSDSMTPEFAAGDVIFSEEVNPEELVAGDIITFISRDSASYGQTITHCIREVTTHNGELAFITYGIATGVDDGAPAVASDVLGRYTFRIAGLGSFFEFLKSVPGYIVCILLPFLVIIGLQIANIVSAVRAARAEKVAAAAAERSRVEALEEEVARLRAQVGGASVGAQTPQPAEAQADIKTAEAQTDGGQTAETAPVEESADKESAAEPPVGNGEQANAAEPPSEAPAEEDTESGN